MESQNRSFKIEITERWEEYETWKNWEVVADTGNKNDGGRQYEYVETEAWKDHVRHLYEQTVDELDLHAVIKAINNL